MLSYLSDTNLTNKAELTTLISDSCWYLPTYLVFYDVMVGIWTKYLASKWNCVLHRRFQYIWPIADADEHSNVHLAEVGRDKITRQKLISFNNQNFCKSQKIPLFTNDFIVCYFDKNMDVLSGKLNKLNRHVFTRYPYYYYSQMTI